MSQQPTRLRSRSATAFLLAALLCVGCKPRGDWEASRDAICQEFSVTKNDVRRSLDAALEELQPEPVPVGLHAASADDIEELNALRAEADANRCARAEEAVGSVLERLVALELARRVVARGRPSEGEGEASWSRVDNPSAHARALYADTPLNPPACARGGAAKFSDAIKVAREKIRADLDAQLELCAKLVSQP